MSIEKFVSGLGGHAVGPGVIWHKVDFHIHAPTHQTTNIEVPTARASIGR
jgi:hypothetical protein